MLAEPIFKFTEELVRPHGQSNNNSTNTNIVTGCNGVSSTTTTTATTARVSLKRPSKLDLAVNLNEQLTVSLTSPQNSSPQQSSSHHHDKNNNSLVNLQSGKVDPHPDPVTTTETENSAKNAAKPATAKKKKRRFAHDMQTNRFSDVYSLTGEELGKGAYGIVYACRNIYTGDEYAVKIIDKYRHPNRERVFKEIEIYLHCRDCANILKIIEFFEEEEKFFVVFEKMEGGPLLNHIEKRGHLTEREASLIVKDIASALNFLHSKGMAHSN